MTSSYMESIQFLEGVKREHRIPIKINKQNCCDTGFVIDSNYDYLVENTRTGLPGITVNVDCPGCRRIDESPSSGNRTARLPGIIPGDVETFDVVVRYDGLGDFNINGELKLRIFLSSNCEGEEPVRRYMDPISIQMVNRFPPKLSISHEVSHISACGEQDGAIDLRIKGGSGNYKYIWTGVDNFARGDQDIDELMAGDYIINVYDNETKEEVQETVSVFEPIAVNFEIRNVSAFGAEDGMIKLDVKCGSCNYHYNWTFPDGNKPTPGTKDLVGIPAGIYNLTVTDNISGLYNSYSIEVDQPDIMITLVSDNISYHGGNDGAIRLSVFDSTGKPGTGSYTYQWKGPNSFLSNDKDLFDLYAGRYMVTVKEYNTGKQATASTMIEEPSADLELSFIVKNVSKFGRNDGSIQSSISGGSGDYEFTWSGPSINNSNRNSKDIKNLSRGLYTISIYDRITCKTTTNSVSVMQPDSEIEIRLKGKSPSQWGGNDGAITVAVQNGEAPYRYAWSGPGIGLLPGSEEDRKDPRNLIAGTYTVTVTDFNNNTSTADIELTQPTMNITWDVTHVDVCGENNNTGQIEVMVSNGVGPYRFEWSGPGITSDNINSAKLEMIPPGIYEVIIEDTATGEIAERTILVRQPSADLSLRFQVKNVSSPGGADGAITAIVEGAKGNENFKYEWRYSEDPDWKSFEETIIGYDIPLDAQPNYTPLQVRSGTYTLKVTAQNSLDPEIGYTDDGPVLTNSITLLEPDPICCIGGLEITLDKRPMTGFGKNDCELRVQFITAPKQPVSYKWLKDGRPFIDMVDQRDGVLTNLGSGTYTVTVTDADGRTATATDSCDCFIDPCKNQRFAEVGETEGNRIPDLIAFNLSPISFTLPDSLGSEYSAEYKASVAHNIITDYFEGEDNEIEVEIPLRRGACCCGDVIVSYENKVPGLEINGSTFKKGEFQAEVDESDSEISKVTFTIKAPELDTVTDDDINICGCLHLKINVICDKYDEFPTYELIEVKTINVCMSNGNMEDLLPGLLSSDTIVE